MTLGLASLLVYIAICSMQTYAYGNYFTDYSIDINNSSVLSKNSDKNDPEVTPCPKASDILPCVCHFNQDHMYMDIDCSGVINDSDFARVFIQIIPFRRFRKLTIGPKVMVLSAGIFDDITFEQITEHGGTLEIVETLVLEPSINTLKEVDFSNNRLIEFPFSIMHQFEVLEVLHLQDNQYESVKDLHSPSVKDLSLGSDKMTDLPVFQANVLPALEVLSIVDSPIQNILPGSFSNLESLQQLTLTGLELFHIVSETFTEDECFTSLSLINSHIKQIDPNAIHFCPNMTVDVSNNDLILLDESTWKPLLEVYGSLDINGNPIWCDCSIAWLVQTSDFQARVIGQCNDGTDFADLTPDNFLDCRQ
ncbi:unnamed protein product [Meganyctiphanes norvegica]|uniref:Oplophorus-luciferin 2-monooxygenase non-catalytic subunit n=1 Tax=Meganyctiphanes norvegica TaxID=48144 RepID=A0AAV2QVZ7_MEGNR